MNMDMNFDFTWDDLSKNLPSNVNGAQKTYEKDTRFWKLSKDENGNGAALIRLLPDKNGTPFIKLFHYGIKKFNPANPKKPLWFIANSPESIGSPCPVKEHYTKLMAEGTTEAAEEAKKFKRQTKFITNIMVVKDPANPENDGKVFLWEFGTKMKDKFVALMNPSDEEKAMGEEPKQLYNPLNGFDFKLKIKKQGEFFTYDGSEVASKSSSLFESKDQAMNFLVNSTYALDEFLQPDFYDSYEELKERFGKFLNGTVANTQDAKPTPAPKTESVNTGLDFDSTPAPVQTPVSVSGAQTVQANGDDDSWLDDL